MDQRNNPVNMGVILQNARPLYFLRHEARCGCRTIHRCQNTDIIPCADLAIGTPKPLKCRLLGNRKNIFLFRILCEAVIALEIAHPDIMFMQPSAGHHRFAHKPDNLSEFNHRFIKSQRLDCHFMTTRHTINRGDTVNRDTFVDRINGNNNIIGRRQVDRARSGRSRGMHLGNSSGLSCYFYQIWK